MHKTKSVVCTIYEHINAENIDALIAQINVRNVIMCLTHAQSDAGRISQNSTVHSVINALIHNYWHVMWTP